MPFIKTAIKEQQAQNKGILHVCYSWNNFLIMAVSSIIATSKRKKVVL